jgi:UDP-N-acetylglucosamine 4,6-dehydratase
MAKNNETNKNSPDASNSAVTIDSEKVLPVKAPRNLEFSLNGKSILVTGGTGSLGRVIIKEILANCSPKRVIVYSRDEFKQFEMQQTKMFQHPCMRFFLGDIRDKERLLRAFQGVDVVIHTAALKQAPAGEYNPSEFIKTNVFGAMNIVDAAIAANVKRVIAVSSDKASSPVTLYGATKLCSDRVFVAANSYSGRTGTRFSATRFGNLMGARGSVIPLWVRQRELGEITLTDPRMTRFSITIEDAAKFVLKCLGLMTGGELYVAKIPSYKLVDTAKVVAPNAKVRLIGIRPGEKLHEMMISDDESHLTQEYDTFYIIHPTAPSWGYTRRAGGKAVPDGFEYHSGNNAQWLTNAEILSFVDKVIAQNKELVLA